MFVGSPFDYFSTVVTVAGSVALPLAGMLYFHAQKLAQRERRALESLELVVENLAEGFYRTDLNGKLITANPSLVAINGYKTEDQFVSNVVNIRTEWYVDPDRGAELTKALFDQGKICNFVSEVYRHKTRERIWISENARLVMNPTTGEPMACEGTVNETTDIMVRIQEEQKLRKLTSHVPGGLFQLTRNPTGAFEVVFASSGFKELLDLRVVPSEFDINHFVSLIHPEDISDYYASLKTSRKSGHNWAHDFRVVTDGGKTKWLQVHATPQANSERSICWYGYIKDISATKADEAVIRNLAYHDALTKLPNRRALIERMEQKIASCQRRNESSALLFIDLDNFKQLNDTHGHDVGDLLLIEFSKRLRQIVRRSDTVSRLAGDEFVVLFDFLGSNNAEVAKKVKLIAHKITVSFERAFNLDGLSYLASASVGGVTFNGNKTSVDDILRLADAAMYDVKKSGRNAFKIVDNDAEMGAHGLANLANTLVGAPERDEFELRFQPQLDRRGTIRGAEALVRWNHPKLGLLTPDKFMHIADKSGQSNIINGWILNSAFETLKCWKKDANRAGLRLSVNIGLQQFLNPEFSNEIKKLVKQYGVDASNLTLELTEKFVSKNRDGSVELLKKLKLTGVHLSLDDFGVDFSSLSLLAEMPLDEIKIDGKFVKSMHNRAQDKALVKSILAMAEALNLSTVAEHVETQSQEKLLMEYGCAAFQGFLYGGAMSRCDFEMAVAQNAVVPDSEETVYQAA